MQYGHKRPASTHPFAMLVHTQKLIAAIQAAIKTCFGATVPPEVVQLQPTRKHFQGSHTLVVFSLTSHLKMAPAAIAEQIGAHLQQHAMLVAHYEVVQGFLNLTLTDAAWHLALREVCTAEHLKPIPVKHKKIVLEFPSPNTNKPLHVGHIRNLLLGDAMTRIFRAVGHEAKAINLVNDRGIHICKSMVAYQRYGQGETPQHTGTKGDHLVGKYYVRFNEVYQAEVAKLTAQLGDAKAAAEQAPILQEARTMLQQWEAGVPKVRALWEKMNSWVYAGFEQTFQALGIQLDKTYYESETYQLGKKLVAQGLQQGVFVQEADGSVWADLTEEGLDRKLLLRADGTAVYMTQDLGSAHVRYEDFHFDQSVYVVGDEQDYHFKVLFQLLAKLDMPYAAQLHHLSYGMVELPEGKMKSREGTVVDADQLIEAMRAAAQIQTKSSGKIDDFAPEAAQSLYHTLAMGALKFFLLKVAPRKKMLFDPKASIDFQGDTGIFVQYTHARIMTLLEKSGNTTLALPSTLPSLAPTVQAIIMQLTQFTRALHEAATTQCPATLAQYLLTLAKCYNHFYAHVPILHQADVAQRQVGLCLSEAVAQTLRHGLALLGIQAPERM